MSGNWRQNWRRERIERGFPSACKKCGAGAVIFTSKTTKNPWRLFHGCPNGSEEVNNLTLFVFVYVLSLVGLILFLCRIRIICSNGRMSLLWRKLMI